MRVHSVYNKVASLSVNPSLTNSFEASSKSSQALPMNRDDVMLTAANLTACTLETSTLSLGDNSAAVSSFRLTDLDSKEETVSVSSAIGSSRFGQAHREAISNYQRRNAMQLNLN